MTVCDTSGQTFLRWDSTSQHFSVLYMQTQGHTQRKVVNVYGKKGMREEERGRDVNRSRDREEKEERGRRERKEEEEEGKK